MNKISKSLILLCEFAIIAAILSGCGSNASNPNTDCVFKQQRDTMELQCPNTDPAVIANPGAVNHNPEVK